MNEGLGLDSLCCGLIFKVGRVVGVGIGLIESDRGEGLGGWVHGFRVIGALARVLAATAWETSLGSLANCLYKGKVRNRCQFCVPENELHR